MSGVEIRLLKGCLRRAAIEGKRDGLPLHIGLAGALSCSLSRQYTTYQNFQD